MEQVIKRERKRERERERERERMPNNRANHKTISFLQNKPREKEQRIN
jgi:hypothetical protein